MKPNYLPNKKAEAPQGALCFIACILFSMHNFQKVGRYIYFLYLKNKIKFYLKIMKIKKLISLDDFKLFSNFINEKWFFTLKQFRNISIKFS